MNSAKEITDAGFAKLKSAFGGQEAAAMIRILKEDILKAGGKGEKAFLEAVEACVKGVPVQYVVGYTLFHKSRIQVNKDVLIPRPETEELVSLVLNENADRPVLRLLDLGTGSACIPVSLAAAQPGWVVFACDISAPALKLARENATLNKVKVSFLSHDLLTLGPGNLPVGIDILVSNPPYVLRAEAANMTKQVLDHEPHLALFVPDDDPLLFYKAIATKARDLLVVGGRVYLECNEAYAQNVALLFSERGYAPVKVHKDLSGKERFVTAHMG